jgi:hypothetical protein
MPADCRQAEVLAAGVDETSPDIDKILHPWSLVSTSRQRPEIKCLKQKLCQRLFESIKRDLPVLMQEMNNQLKITRRSIDQLGSVRKTAKDCLWQIAEIRRSMHQLAS